MKKNVTTIFLVLCSLQLSAQLKINIKFGGGLGSSAVFQESKINSEITRVKALKFSPAFSYSIGPNINYSFNKIFEFSADILFANNAFNQKEIFTTNYFHINNYFLLFPISIKTKINQKASINIGFVNNIFLNSSYEYKSGIKNYKLGITAGFSYHINDKIELSCDLNSDVSPYMYFDEFLFIQKQYNYGASLSLMYAIFDK